MLSGEFVMSCRRPVDAHTSLVVCCMWSLCDAVVGRIAPNHAPQLMYMISWCAGLRPHVVHNWGGEVRTVNLPTRGSMGKLADAHMERARLNRRHVGILAF